MALTTYSYLELSIINMQVISLSVGSLFGFLQKLPTIGVYVNMVHKPLDHSLKYNCPVLLDEFFQALDLIPSVE